MWIIIFLILGIYIVIEYGWIALLIFLIIIVLGIFLQYSVKKNRPGKNHKETMYTIDDSPDDDSLSTDDIIKFEMIDDFEDDFFD